MSDQYYPAPQHLRRVNAALALRDVPDYPAALQQLQQAARQAPTNIDVLLALGLVYQDLDDPDQAETVLRKALGYAPDSELVRASLASLLLSEHRWDLAIDLLEPLIERKAANPDIWYYYALAYSFSPREDIFDWLFEIAQATFAPRQTPRAILESIWQARLKYLNMWFDPVKNQELLERGLLELPDSQVLRKGYAHVLLRLGNFERGLEIVEKLKEEGMTGLQNEEYLARLALEQEREASNLAYRFEGQGIEFTRAARILDEHGRVEQAIRAAEHAVEYEHMHVMAALDMARLLAQDGRTGPARRAIQRIFDDDVDTEDEGLEWFIDELHIDLDAEAILGCLDLLESNYTEAIKRFNTVLQSEFTDGYWYQLPIFCCRHDNASSPLPLPHHQEVKLLVALGANLATANCLTGDFDEALAFAKAAVGAIPTNRDESEASYAAHYVAHAVLGCVHLVRGETEQARQAWRDALAVIDNSPNLQNATELLQQWLNDLDE